MSKKKRLLTPEKRDEIFYKCGNDERKYGAELLKAQDAKTERIVRAGERREVIKELRTKIQSIHMIGEIECYSIPVEALKRGRRGK